jgi:hypothetical protein
MLWEIDNNGVTLVDCDEFTTFILAALETIGAQGRIVTVGFRPTNGKRGDPRILQDPQLRVLADPMARLPGPFTHVFAQARKPGAGWVTLDPVAGPRTANMHRRVKQMRIYVPD